MIFEQFRCGGDRNFGYLLADRAGGRGALVDPSPDPEPLLARAAELGLDVVYLVNTHDHGDHSGGNRRVQAATGARRVLHRSSPLAQIAVSDGDTLALGKLVLTFLSTPGHTPDSICVLAENRLLSGDTLFVGKIGGTADEHDARIQFASLKRIMALDPAISVWPGHDVGAAPGSTIGREAETNPFCLRLKDFAAFCELKRNWAAYKREHGIP
jgi:hydroxyacylglutathione hydrolase